MNRLIQRTDLGSRPSQLAARLRPLVMATMLLLAVGVGIGIDRVLLQFTPVGAATQFTQLEEFQILEETYDAIRENYVESDEITDQELIYGASQGMINALGDEGHSTFLDPQAAEDFERSSRGELIGIGIQVDTTGDLPVVVYPIDGSPAFEAGILPGDTILEVDGQSLEFMDPEEATELIRGEEGTDVTLLMQHEGESEPYELTLTRTLIDLNPVSWAMLPGNVMWLRISGFSKGATDGVEAALQEAKELGAESVILDLRNNPGGLVFEAIGVGSQFMPGDSVLYQEQDREGNVDVVETVGIDGEWQEGPLVVLINEGSASAAEIVSSSLRDNGRAELYGERTFGTGTVLLPFELSDESVALLGIELWLTADGEEIWKRGVEPTVEVANEVGATLRLPFQYDDNDLSEQEFGELEDEQLMTAYDEARELAETGS